MAIGSAAQSRSQQPVRTGNPQREGARPSSRRSQHRVVPDPINALEAPPIVTVFRRPEGGLHHARCRQPLSFQGTRGGLELDFYCLRCVEHVTLPESVIHRVPLGPSVV